MRGGSIIPAGRVVQNLNENSFEPLTLIVCPDENGNASGSLYWDEGDGWSFRDGNYKKINFTARRNGRNIEVSVADSEGNYPLEIGKVNVEVLTNGKTLRSSGTLNSPITVKI